MRSRVLHRDNIAYLCIYLRNAGERLRAIMLAADVFNLNVNQAKEWVDSVTYIREKIDNSKAREAFAQYPTDLIAEVSLEDSYEIRVSHFPSEEDVLLRMSDPLAAGAQPAAPATQEPTSHPEGAATFKTPPSITDAAKELRLSPHWEYESILSRLLGEQLRQDAKRLDDLIDDIEMAHFRTNQDTGANFNALLIWNIIREKAGRPALRIRDLPAYCVTCGTYHVNPHQRAAMQPSEEPKA